MTGHGLLRGFAAKIGLATSKCCHHCEEESEEAVEHALSRHCSALAMTPLQTLGDNSFNVPVEVTKQPITELVKFIKALKIDNE